MGLALILFTAAGAPLLAHGGQFRGPTSPSPPTRGDDTSGQGDDAAWSRWWDFNRDAYLELKNAVAGRDLNEAREGPDDPAFLFARGRVGGRRADLRPDSAVIHGTVVPALLAALEGQRDVDLVTALLMALAKIGDLPGDEHDVIGALRGWLKSSNGEIQETAALALGILGDSDAAPLLVALALDEPEGRVAIGGGHVPVRTQAFATYGLGLIGNASKRTTERRFVVHHLVRILEREVGAARPDIGTAAVLSLGLVPVDDGVIPEADKREPERPAASRQATIAYLTNRLTDERFARGVRALIPVALVRLEQGATPSMKSAITESLVPLVRDDKAAEFEVRQGSLHALGLLGDDDEDVSDQRIRAALEFTLAEGDRVARNLALIALGRVVGRKGTEPHGTARVTARARLAELLVRGQSAQRPWAALALGLLERSCVAEGAAPSEGLRLALRERLASTGSPSERGALVTALGLVGDLEAGLDVMRWLDTGDFALRSQAAISLGLMGYTPAIPRLMSLVQTGERHPGIVRDAAIALALLRHKPVIPALVQLGAETRDMYVRGSVARALAFVGDASAVEPMLRLLQGRRSSETARTFAGIVLGVVCDKEAFPWNAKLAQDLGWSELPPTLYDPQRLKGVVDLF